MNISVTESSHPHRALLTAVLGVAVAASTLMVQSAQHPNFLWLISEDMGPALGCYGQQEVETPVLDQMARDGVRYTRAYTTAPVCSPSRSAFMTGMYATTIGAHQHRTTNKHPLPEGVRVLTDWMRDAGYFTANLKQLPETFGFKGTGKTDWNFIYEGQPFDSANWEDLKAHQPFLAQINFHETHRVFNGPNRADPANVPLPPYYADHPVARQDYARYLDAAMELDRKIGLILQQLEVDGLASNTVVIFMGDNGEAHVRAKQFCYEEGLHVPLIVRWPKGLPAPKHFQPGRVDDRFVAAIDLAPTLLSLAGAAIPAKMQGQPFLGEEVKEPRRYLFGARDRCDETAMRIRTVRGDRYRYIRNFTPDVPFFATNAYKAKQYPMWNLIQQLNAEGKLTPAQAVLCAPRMPDEELYDLEGDPHEIQNLAQSDRPEHQAALKQLRAVLDQWIVETDDQGRFPETTAVGAEDAGQRKPRRARQSGQ